MRLSRAVEKRTPGMAADIVFPQQEEAKEVIFDIRQQLSEEDRLQYRSEISETADRGLKLNLASDYALAFPEDREHPREVIGFQLPLTESELHFFRGFPRELLILFPEASETLLPLLGNLQEIKNRGVRGLLLDYLVVAYLFCPEHVQWLPELREAWTKLVAQDREKSPSRVPFVLSWLKITDPELYATLAVSQAELRAGLKEFEQARAERTTNSGKGFDNESLPQAFALHVLSGGDAVWNGQGVVTVGPKARASSFSAGLPGRLDM